MTALRLVRRDPLADFHAAQGEIARRMRLRAARAATPDAVTYPGWRVSSPGILDQLGRVVFWIVILLGCGLWGLGLWVLGGVVLGCLLGVLAVATLKLCEKAWR